MYQPKNILITGGCGFIGSNFINKMMAKYPNYNFINIDALYYCASLNNISNPDNKNYTFIKGNLINYDLILNILHTYNIDTILHFAAQSHVDNSFSNPLQYTRDNILGTHTLLEASRIYGKIRRFIHVSTDEVYGESMLKSDENKKNEETVLCPTNPYAATKAGAELIAMSYYHSFKMPIIVSRGNNVYGINQYPEKLIPKFIQLLNNNKKITIQGDGSNVRSFIYVDDVVNAFDLILHKGSIGEIYNIGGGDECEYSVLDVSRILVYKMKNDDADNHIEYIRDREFNDKRYYISNNKLKSLGWEQTIDFNEGINKCIEWYSNLKENYWN